MKQQAVEEDNIIIESKKWQSHFGASLPLLADTSEFDDKSDMDKYHNIRKRVRYDDADEEYLYED
jgi:hypothetical protein